MAQKGPIFAVKVARVSMNAKQIKSNIEAVINQLPKCIPGVENL